MAPREQQRARYQDLTYCKKHVTYICKYDFVGKKCRAWCVAVDVATTTHSSLPLLTLIFQLLAVILQTSAASISLPETYFTREPSGSPMILLTVERPQCP